MGRIKDLTVTFISLVKRPANGKPLILKSENGKARTFKIVKTDDEQQRVYGIVYSPDEDDSHGDSADAVTIRRAANGFMRDGRTRNVDTEHSLDPELAYVAESWLVRSGEPLFPEEAEGAWAVGIQVTDPDLWRQVKAGDYEGLSLYGYGRYDESEAADAPIEAIDSASEPSWFKRWIQKITKGEDMTEEDVRRILQEELAKSKLAESSSKSESEATPPGSESAEAEGPSVEDVVVKAVEKAIEKAMPELAKALRKGKAEGGSDQPEPASFA